MKTFTTKEIVNQLIGSIRPTGESGVDKQRLENLKDMCELVLELVVQIDLVNCDFYQSPAQSERTASEYALDFLTKELGIV